MYWYLALWLMITLPYTVCVRLWKNWKNVDTVDSNQNRSQTFRLQCPLSFSPNWPLSRARADFRSARKSIISGASLQIDYWSQINMFEVQASTLYSFNNIAFCHAVAMINKLIHYTRRTHCMPAFMSIKPKCLRDSGLIRHWDAHCLRVILFSPQVKIKLCILYLLYSMFVDSSHWITKIITYWQWQSVHVMH
jgi:hypothetical protein